MRSRPQWSVLHQGSFASVKTLLPPNTAIHCESDAIVSFSGDNLDIQGFVSGGFFASILRFLFSEESFFTTRIENKQDFERTEDCLLAAQSPGDVVLHTLDGVNELLLIRGAYLASDDTVQIETKVQRHLTNSMFSGTGFVLLRAYGTGVIALTSYGAIHKYTLGRGEVRTVDNGHLLGWTAGMSSRVGMLKKGGLLASATSGEGLMCYFTGPGEVYVQSHQEPRFLEGEVRDKKRRAGGGNTALACFLFFIVVGVVCFAVLLFAVLIPADRERMKNYALYDSAGRHSSSPSYRPSPYPTSRNREYYKGDL